MTTTPTGKPLGIEETPIPGFLRIDLTVHGDNRGWFKENWQREKMIALGLPDFHPVQNNISFNDEVGVTRGIHAEPWDKFVSVATGRVFGAWVDLREGPSFGTVYTTEIDPSVAVYVPRGVGNAYQTLEPNTAYTYLVNDHWSPDAKYTFLNLADETVAVPWPIPLSEAIQSDKDRAHPRLAEVTPFPAPIPTGGRVLVTGANGQLGRELMKQLPEAGYAATGVDLPDVDISDATSVEALGISSYDVVINAAGWTDVDGAETDEGRLLAWRANAVGPALLANSAARAQTKMVHVSSEYVFDGKRAEGYDENATPSPLGVYGQSKAGGDAAVTAYPYHYLIRTSWVVGSGRNFLRTMAGLAHSGATPKVVSDQVGRLTFADDLARGIIHLLSTDQKFGTYNITGSGAAMSWAEIARVVFESLGRNPNDIAESSSEEYTSSGEHARRPLCSLLHLQKIESTGFIPPDSRSRIAEYLSSLNLEH
ncbi:sugar nucleotide-binding protein [Actinomyces culturomici]|uniref:sugar nucleotide-binding protein n=1 Tax=Actinomyces culturomici TaxID=1926276 RepID=UPI000E203412|nr:bifunctional dTDP-4-dehydrorhamnose 3,5-epimerase family protein/NAD(P)-dependent oxidoreductase [Actinomyces culturomici]